MRFGSIGTGLGARFLVAVTLLVCGAPRSGSAGPEGVDIEALDAFLLRSADGDDLVELPAIGEDVFLNAAYELHGTDDDVPASVRALIDGTPFCSGDIDLAVGDVFQLICPQAWRATAGMHTLRWVLDDMNEVTESDEDNNVVEFQFIVADVDLVAERASLRTDPETGEEVEAPFAGQAIFFDVEYALNDIDETINTGIQALIDGELACEGFIDFAPGPDSIFCTDPWIATPGEHTLRWIVDDTDFVSETDEGNNVAEITFNVVARPDVDLRAGRSFLRADSTTGPDIITPEPGRPVLFYVEIESTADVSADVSAFLDDDDEPFCTGILLFEEGATAVFCPMAWPAIAGPHTVRWVIDENNLLPETDETNNAETLRFGVGTPVACPGDCNDSGDVTSDEVVRGIMIMLGLYDVDACSAFDADLNGFVTIDEAVRAIELASGGCQVSAR